MGSIQYQKETSNDEEEGLFAMQLVGSVVLPMVMHTVLELKVLEIIARAGEGAHLSPVEIVSHLPTQNPDAPGMLDRMLRLLANYSVLTCSTVVRDNGNVVRLYGLTPVCKYFIPNEDGISFAPWMNINHEDACIRPWTGLKSAILEGGDAFNKVHGMTIFEYAREHPQLNQSFNMGMFSHTTFIMKKVLEAPKNYFLSSGHVKLHFHFLNKLEVYRGFESLKELIDVAGGIGTASDVIISKYPTIKCINLDLPHVIRSAPSRPGIQHVEGDMFVSIPKGEAIFMKWILHDWDDAHCIKILQNCYKALPDNGIAIVIDLVVSDTVEDTVKAKVTSQMDLIMIACLPGAGAKERTEKEFEALAKAAGFHSIKFVCCVFNYWVMEFHKMAPK